MCPVSIFDLPSENLEHILLFLPPMEILKMKAVNRFFLDLISASQYLQHRIDLFSAGLVDNPNSLCSFAEHRARLRQYADGWKDTESSVRYDCPIERREVALNPIPHGQDLFSAPSDDSTAISFLRLPSSPDQEVVEEWTLEFPFRFESHVVCPQNSLLAVVERGTGFVNIHLLSLLDGSPHELPLQKVIALDLGGYRNPMVINTQISCSRIALLIESSRFAPDGTNRELIAWDWKTGEVVFKYSSGYTAMGRAIYGISTMSFLDGFWLLVLYHEGASPQLLVLNTLLPRHDPKSWRILGLPLRGTPRCYNQYENAPTEHPQFSVDPAQRIFVVVLMNNCALIIPVELLIRRMHSVRSRPYIGFDEWMEDVTEVPLHPTTHTLQVFDVKILALSGSAHHPEAWGVQMFDLSKSGRRDAQLLPDDEGMDGGFRRVLSTPKWFVRCDVLGDGIPRSTRIVGNRVVCFYYEPSDPDRPYFLRVLKMG